MFNSNLDYAHYTRTSEGEDLFFRLYGDIEKYTDPEGELYRMHFISTDGSTNLLYISRDTAKELFEQFLPEFMIKQDDGSYEEEPEETYALTPRGRALADGLHLVTTVIKTTTTPYDDDGPSVEVIETYGKY